MRLAASWRGIAICAAVELSVVAAGGARAERPRPTCVQFVLPDHLSERKTWRELLAQESRLPSEAEGATCAIVEVHAPEAEGGDLTLRVKWLGTAREAVLAALDVSPAQQARAGALLARGLLQQLEQDAPATSGVPPPPPPEPAAAAAPPLTSPATSVAAPPTPPAARPASRRRAAQDPELLASHRTRRWTASALAGAILYVEEPTTVARLELVAQRAFAPWPLHVGLSLVGTMAVANDRRGELWLGGVGLRATSEVALLERAFLRVWLGPGLTWTGLVLGQHPAGSGSSRSLHSAAHADLRARLELTVRRRAHLALAADLGYALQHLRVRAEGRRLLTYDGVLIGLSAGCGFKW